MPTEQQHAGREAAASEARLRGLAAAVSCGVLVRDATGAIVDANPAAEQILGQPLGAMRDRRWTSVLQDTRREDGSSIPRIAAKRLRPEKGSLPHN